jgi:hypothetical protein
MASGKDAGRNEPTARASTTPGAMGKIEINGQYGVVLDAATMSLTKGAQSIRNT